MNFSTRLVGYLLILAILAGLPLAVPASWASPEQAQTGAMTVPTRTPRPSPSPSVPPTSVPPTEAPPQGATTPAPGQPPQAPGTSTPTPISPVATPTPTTRLVLVKELSRSRAWPGATLTYTITLINEGAVSARQVTIEDALPPELDPGAIHRGAGAVWDGRVLRAQAEILPPGARLVVAFNAQVRSDAQPGRVVVNRADASASGAERVSASAFAALPPAELPPTGRLLEGGCEPPNPPRPANRR